MATENNSIPYVQTFSGNNCFLCGKNILKQYSVEHIFPKWLQKDFNLWNDTIQLINGSSIPYRYLTVPCCQVCNNKYLSKVENIIHRSVSEGFTKFKSIDESIIFQWIGKIFYPWSIFLFNVDPFGDEKFFDYSDDTGRGSIKIRIRDIGIVACLMDNGTIKNKIKEWFSCVSNRLIHPLQFEELAAIVFYLNMLLDRNPTFVNLLDNTPDDPQLTVVPLPIGGYSLKPIFREWNVDDYSIVLTEFLKKYGFSHGDLVRGEYITSFTFNPDGTYIPMDIKKSR